MENQSRLMEYLITALTHLPYQANNQAHNRPRRLYRPIHNIDEKLTLVLTNDPKFNFGFDNSTRRI